MTRAQAIVAARLLDMAADEFHEHGCNDIDPELWEGLSVQEIADLSRSFAIWRRAEGDPGWRDSVQAASDDGLMRYLAYIIGGPKE